MRSSETRFKRLVYFEKLKAQQEWEDSWKEKEVNVAAVLETQRRLRLRLGSMDGHPLSKETLRMTLEIFEVSCQVGRWPSM